MPLYSEIRFIGYSMYPFLRPGDKLIIRETDFSSLQIGDIILFRYGDNLVAHRLVKRLPGLRGVFKGDSLLTADSEAIGPKDILGRVEAVIRKDRFISLRTGFRFRAKRLFSLLSLYGLLPGILSLRLKKMLVFIFQSDHKAPTAELDILSDILKGEAAGPLCPLQWARIEKRAYREGVAGIMYNALKGLEVTSDVRSRLREYYLQIAAHNLLIITALEKIERLLTEEEFEVMTLKGASLIENSYKELGSRPMADMDLMVRAEDRARFEKILSSLDFIKDPVSLNRFRNEGLLIDLHTHALNVERVSNRRMLFPAGMEPIWNNSAAWGRDFRWIRRPDETDNILLLSQHYMKHSFSCLIWLFDIYLLLKERDSHGWSRLFMRAGELSQEKPLSYVLFLLNSIFRLRPPAGTPFENGRYKLSRLERGILEAGEKDHPIDRAGPLMALFCIRTLKSKILFIRETLFPKDSILKAEFHGGPKGANMVFYPQRVFMSVKLIFKQGCLILQALIKG